MRAHQTPDPVFLDAFHEEVGDPERVEQIPGALFLFAVVLAEVEELHDVGMPGLQVDSKCTGTLVATLEMCVTLA